MFAFLSFLHCSVVGILDLKKIKLNFISSKQRQMTEAGQVHPGLNGASPANSANGAAPIINNGRISLELQRAENDRRRKIASKCLELEEMLESQG